MYLYSASSCHASDALPLPVSRLWSPLASLFSQVISEHCETTNTGWCITPVYSPRRSPGRPTYSSLPQRARSGWVGLGVWFRPEVVYPSKDGHLLRSSTGTCYHYTKPATCRDRGRRTVGRTQAYDRPPYAYAGDDRQHQSNLKLDSSLRWSTRCRLKAILQLFIMSSELRLPEFLQQNTGDFCLSVMFVKDNMMLFHVYVFVCSGL